MQRQKQSVQYPKYVYLIPQGGFNDILYNINRLLEYCKKYNRILLIDTTNTHYKINFSDYFSFPNKRVICDKNKIIEICNNNHTIYPDFLHNNIQPLLTGVCVIDFMPGSYHDNGSYNNKLITLPRKAILKTIIVYSSWGSYFSGYPLFQQMTICDAIKTECKKRHDLLQKPYLCIQVRNTDYKCDYQKVYTDNKVLIHSYNNIYLATDDKSVIDFYKLQNLPIINFTTFPDGNSENLHDSNVNSHTKIIDLICDVYLIAMSGKLLSNSSGGFIKFVTECFNNKGNIINQFNHTLSV